MSNYFTIDGRIKPLNHSLVRYFKHCLNKELVVLNPLTSIRSFNFELLYTVNDAESLEMCCQWLFRNRSNPDKLRIMGYSMEYDINLLDLESLNKQVEDCLLEKKRLDWAEISFFRDRIKIFFQGHGEQSLLECLTYAKYYFENYFSLLKTGEYNANDLWRKFFLPGVDTWNGFVHRFIKHAPVLYVVGWVDEIEKTTRLVKIISSDLNQIDSLELFVIFEFKSLSHLSEILAIMNELAQRTD